VTNYGWSSDPAGGAAQPPPPPGYTSVYGGVHAGYRPPYLGIRSLRTTLVVLLALAAAAALGGIGAALNRKNVAHDVFDNNEPSVRAFTRLDEADDAVAATIGIWLLLFVAIAVVMIIWWFRVARNTRALGRDGHTWKAGWAIGGWFIPLANFVLPYLVLQEAYQASDPDPSATGRWRQSRRLPLIWVWMVAAGAMSILTGLDRDVELTGDVAELLDDVDSQAAAISIWMTAAIASAVLALVTVHVVTKRQEQARARLVSSPVPPPPPPGAAPLPPPFS